MIANTESSIFEKCFKSFFFSEFENFSFNIYPKVVVVINNIKLKGMNSFDRKKTNVYAIVITFYDSFVLLI